eukprot:gnl/MRDRNA2_/MRDRNA2_57278_c0_seq1.p1 gnl/MRDRNA2_/MRDRNA2_57278_c0~~gnl/MRDRNA2_/MRDRNA2_57278_c0_seq1.p1  ORF type:complete len:152 (-),score=12.81 gnl/MRDRNA2_/MRDRNA2_57278_c0_seq1:8-463(-)
MGASESCCTSQCPAHPMRGRWDVAASIHKMPENEYKERHYKVTLKESTGVVTGDHDGALLDVRYIVGDEMTCKLIFNHDPDTAFNVKGHFTRTRCQTVVTHPNGTRAKGMATWTWTRTDASAFPETDDSNLKASAHSFIPKAVASEHFSIE